MRSVSAIQFTQEQVRTLTGASVETVRHWRKAVPYLAEKSGKAARFAFSDVVALAITHELVRTFGVQIASVGIGIDSLFRLLSQTNHQSLDGRCSIHHARGRRIVRRYTTHSALD